MATPVYQCQVKATSAEIVTIDFGRNLAASKIPFYIGLVGLFIFMGVIAAWGMGLLPALQPQALAPIGIVPAICLTQNTMRSRVTLNRKTQVFTFEAYWNESFVHSRQTFKFSQLTCVYTIPFLTAQVGTPENAHDAYAIMVQTEKVEVSFPILLLASEAEAVKEAAHYAEFLGKPILSELDAKELG